MRERLDLAAILAELKLTEGVDGDITFELGNVVNHPRGWQLQTLSGQGRGNVYHLELPLQQGQHRVSARLDSCSCPTWALNRRGDKGFRRFVSAAWLSGRGPGALRAT